jgi:hypothetical protein
VITNDRRIRTRPLEAQLAIEHRLKVVHLYGNIGNVSAWDQLVRIANRWESIENQVARAPDGPWWLSLRRGTSRLMNYEPGKPER